MLSCVQVYQQQLLHQQQQRDELKNLGNENDAATNDGNNVGNASSANVSDPSATSNENNVLAKAAGFYILYNFKFINSLIFKI